MIPASNANPRRSLRASLLLGCALPVVKAFNLPSTLPASRQATNLGLRRHYLASNKIFRKKNCLQSTYALGEQGPVGNMTTTGLGWSLEEQFRRTRFSRASTSESEKPNKREEKAATVASSTVNLIKTILGTGVLALPAGVAAVSDMPIALVPASALMLILGVLSAYTFQLYGRLAHETQATSLGEIWERTVGEKSSWVISAGTFSFCFGVALVYSLVIGDFLSSLAVSLGTGFPALMAKRQFWILSVTISILFPLSNLKSLAALAPMSVLGTAGTILTTIFMVLRCPAVVPGSPYSVASGAVGKFAAAAAPNLAPQFGSFHNIFSPAALIIASMSTTAYLGHFNAPAFYHGFKKPQSAKDGATPVVDTEDNEKAMRNYGKMTAFGFVGCTLMNVIIMAMGFLTFGGNSAGVVLNNYATGDKGAVFSRLLMTISVIGGYPFMVRGCRENFVQLYNKLKKGERASQANVEKWVVHCVMAIATSLALVISDAGLVVSLVGAIMGSAIIYVFPAMMFLSHSGKRMKAAGGIASRRMKLERLTSRFLTTFGIVAGVIGATVSVINSYGPHLLR